MPRHNRPSGRAQGQKTRSKKPVQMSTYQVPRGDKERALTEQDLRSIELIMLTLKKGESNE